MFVTLEEFFDNYRIQNQQQPNETVLNRGLMRLKRETRELKALVDILTGGEIPAWNSTKIYEIDEYVSHENLIYKSIVDRNSDNTPDPATEVDWELVSIGGSSSGGSKLFYQNYEATDGQTSFVTPFNMNDEPMIFIEGILLDEDRYTKVSNVEVQLESGAALGEKVVIASGVTYDSSLVIAKQQFTATAGQYIFETDFGVKNPAVFLDGTLLDDSLYTWQSNSVELETPCTGGEIVIIGNGSVLGSEIYTTQDTDALLDLKRDIADSYSITQTDDLLDLKSDITYVDGLVSGLESAKADIGVSLAEYGILDAYTIAQADALLDLKMDFSFFTDEVVMQKVQNEDGSGSGLDADLLDGLEGSAFLRADEAAEKISDLSVVRRDETTELKVNEIYFDVSSEDPTIKLAKYDASEDLIEEATVYTDKNTSDIMIIREGYFKGVWEPTLDTTFGITNYADYNWTVIVTPTLTGFEHDYNASFADGHTPFTGFDNNITWDENQSEYHFGYIEDEIIKMESFHKNGTTRIDIPAKYHLVGVLNTFSTYEWVNQPI